MSIHTPGTWVRELQRVLVVTLTEADAIRDRVTGANVEDFPSLDPWWQYLYVEP